MNRKPFSLDEWKKNQSRKVVTEFGEPVKIVFTDGTGDYPVLAVIYDGNATDSAWYKADGRGHDGRSGLFFDEPELTPFQQCLVKFYNDRFTLPHDKDGVCNRHDLDELLDKAEKELLLLANEQFKENLKEYVDDVRQFAYNKGIMDASNGLHWKKVPKGETMIGEKGRPSFIIRINHFIEPAYFVTEGQSYICLSELDKLPEEAEEP